MSQKKKKLISEEISELLKPRELLDPENEDDDTAAHTKYANWSDEEAPVSVGISDIRRGNVKDVTKSNKKYKGEVVSRVDFEDPHESESSYDGSDDEGVEEEESQDDNEESQKEEQSESEEESEEEEVGSDEETPEILPADATDNVRKGESVKNQLKIWEKLLEMRIKLQKLVQCGNSVPFGDVYTNLSAEPEFKAAATEAAENVTTLLEKMQNLKSSLLENYPETRGMKRKLSVSEPDTDFIEYRKSVLRKWHDRTKVGSKAKNLETQDIIQKIENTLINRNELLKRVQVYRAGYPIIGSGPLEEGSIVPELYDDADFYHNLLRELIEYKTSLSDNAEIDSKLLELQSIRSKMKKKVDGRASKGRKIRYVTHNKMVNFMAPETDSTWTEEGTTELYGSLFGKANNNTVDVQ